MEKLKKIIIILFCLILIILISVIFILKNNGNAEDTYNDYSKQKIIESEFGEEPEEYIQTSEYFTVKSTVQTYLDILNKEYSVYYTREESGDYSYDENMQKQMIYSLLSNSYIQKNNISEANLYNFVKPLEEKQLFYPLEIKKMHNSEVISYKVSGIMQDLKFSSSSKFYGIVNISYPNEVFSIEPISEKTYNEYNDMNSTIVENKEYNQYSIQNISNETIASEYFQLYKFYTLANPELTYERMPEEYRNKKFESLENYKKYIKDNYNEFVGLRADKFLAANNGKTIVKDQYQNLYIFETTSMLDFKVILDEYTLLEEDVIQKYEQSDSRKKVQMNIDRFFQMINRHDYRTSYNCLDETFRKNNMQSEEQFENIAKKIFFAHNKISYSSLEELGNNTYSAKIKLTDLTEENSESKYMTIIMRLGEGTDFVMSFSME